MSSTPWDIFRKEKLIRIFSEKPTVIDIGGGLRASREKGNVYEEKNAWLTPYLEGIRYLVLDPVPDYHPDIVGDIHKLPFPDNSQDAYVCIAVLEHVHDPIRAFEEMHRTLKPGGYLFLYVPFLYPYHPYPGYYGDFWRFTDDTLRRLCEPFSFSELQNVRGALETLVYLSPLRALPGIQGLARFLDRMFGKTASRQTSGYYVFAQK